MKKVGHFSFDPDTLEIHLNIYDADGNNAEQYTLTQENIDHFLQTHQAVHNAAMKIVRARRAAMKRISHSRAYGDVPQEMGGPALRRGVPGHPDNEMGM